MASFSYPRFYKWLSFFGILFFGSLAASLVWHLLENHKSVVSTCVILAVELLLVLLIFSSYDFFRRSNDKFFLEESGIHITSRDGNRFVGWNEISQIKSHDILQRIELCGRNGERIVTIDYQLAGFDDLRNELLSKINKSSKFNQKVFHPSIFQRVFILLCITFLTITVVYYWYSHEILNKVARFGMYMCAIVDIYLIIGYLIGIKHILIEQDSVKVRCILRSTVIPFLDISDILLRNVADGEGDTIATVVIETKAKKAIRLSWIRGGSVCLYKSLYNAWQDYIAKSH